MATPNNTEILLEECVNELRRVYDYIVRTFEHVRNKALALLVGEVTVAIFLYSDIGKSSLLTKKSPLYGYAFFGIGTALLFFAFYKFLRVVSTVTWAFPTEDYDMKNPTARFNDSRLEFLEYLHSEYYKKIPHCISIVKQRSKWFMEGIYALTGGVFFVILVKYLGGA